MNTEVPPKGSRRARVELLIWLSDLVRYLAVGAIGIAFTSVPPPIFISATIGMGHDTYVTRPTLVLLLSGLYILGGAWGFITRLFKLGLYEMPAVWISGGGLAVTGMLATWSVAVGNAGSATVIAYSLALLALFTRRILELRALTSEPAPIAR